METPQIRPGLVRDSSRLGRVIVFFHNSAEGNLAIQLVTSLGVPSDQLGVTPPDGIEGAQGMVLSIACPDSLRATVESTCRSLGGQIHRQN